MAHIDRGRTRLGGIATRGAVTLVVALISVASFALPAFAHAFLIRSNPDPGARLSSAPASLTLQFSEALTKTGTAVTVTVLGKVRSLSLPIRLADGGLVVHAPLPFNDMGIYEVKWQSTSADDGHVAEGDFAFAVGSVTGELPASTTKASAPSPLGVISNWIVFVGLSFAAGGLATALVVDAAIRRRFLLARAGMLVGFAGALLSGSEAIARIGGVNAAPARVIALTLFAASFLAMALPASLLASARSRRPYVAFALVLGAIGAWSGLGHGDARLGIGGWIAEGVHLGVVAIWTGALVYLVADLRRARRDDGNVWPIAHAYSRLALVTVAALSGSGIYLAVALLPNVNSLWTTGYGQLLLVKSGLLLIALALALISRQRGLRLKSVRLLRRLAPFEAGALVVVLIVAAVLVEVGPPAPSIAASSLLGAPPLSGAVAREAGLAGELTVGVAVGDGQIEIEVYAAESQLAGTVISATIRGPGQESDALRLAGCGAGCATVSVRPRIGTSQLDITTSAPGWLGGHYLASVTWPPPPANSQLLSKVIATMEALPKLSVSEVASTGHYRSAKHVTTLSGRQFIAVEPYAKGAADVRELPRGERGLSLDLPGDYVWVTLILDAKDRVVRETIINAGNELERTFAYP